MTRYGLSLFVLAVAGCAELESMLAEKRNLESRVSFATIVATYRDDVSPGPIGWLLYGAHRGVRWLFVWD